MNPPQYLLDIIDKHAGRTHSRDGVVATALADVLDVVHSRDRIRGALRDEWFRRVEKIVVATPDEHIDALTDAVMRVLERDR